MQEVNSIKRNGTYLEMVSWTLGSSPRMRVDSRSLVIFPFDCDLERRDRSEGRLLMYSLLNGKLLLLLECKNPYLYALLSSAWLEAFLNRIPMSL